jgi:hypothetical protein
MKFNQNNFKILFMTVLFLSLIHNIGKSQHGIIQDDPILAPNVLTAPTIDGKGDDACWQNVPWQRIAQVWIPYGEVVDSIDYFGRYKVIWSSTTNLLYFLIEIQDDVFVDGFVSGVTADIYNFDISEVFIDENASGGEHRYDGTSTNAENAFAYHMYADCPADGEVTTVCQVDDMAGTQSNSHRADYSSHFPEFTLRRIGNIAVREFSLIVYNDTYTESNKEAARAQLALNKEMGLSVAYCDNDDPNENPKVRDNMFGSVWEPSPGNLHWQNADYFGHVKLIDENPSSVENRQPISANVLKLYPNPSSSSSHLEVENLYRGEVSIRLFNLLGQEIFSISTLKVNQIFTYTLHLQRLPPSLYFVQMTMGHTVYSEKLIVTHKR